MRWYLMNSIMVTSILPSKFWFTIKSITRSTNTQGVLLTQLEEKLTSEQMELVNQFHSHLIDVNGLETKASFQYGFSLGLMLMKEAQELLTQENL